MLKSIKRLFKEESGQGMAEYGLILALVAVLLIGALSALQGGLANTFGKVTAEVNK
jgi:pilus assembly protein Flp/PilA